MFTAVKFLIWIFLFTTSYNLVGGCQYFGGTHYNSLESTLKIEVAYSYETTVWHTAVCHYPEDCKGIYCFVHIVLGNKYTLLLLNKWKIFLKDNVIPSWNVTAIFQRYLELITNESRITEFWQMIFWICHGFPTLPRSKKRSVISLIESFSVLIWAKDRVSSTAFADSWRINLSKSLISRTFCTRNCFCS